MLAGRIGRASLHLALVLGLFGAHAACGGGNGSAPPASPAATRSSEVATGNTLTEFQKRRLLGHYSTRDGASGFILDRTVTPWRAKLDGTEKVVTLEKTNTPRQGESEYTSADHSIWIRVDDERGEVLLFDGPKQNQGVDVVRDADAHQLK